MGKISAVFVCATLVASAAYWYWPTRRAVGNCDAAILYRLVAPAGAKFSGGVILDEDATGKVVNKWVDDERKRQTTLISDPYQSAVSAWTQWVTTPYRIIYVKVDSQNHFGAMLRSTARCALMRDGSVSVLSID